MRNDQDIKKRRRNKLLKVKSVLISENFIIFVKF